MLPLRDVQKPRKTPWATRLLITANIVVFVWQMVMRHVLHLAPEADFGAIPLCYASPGSCGLSLPQDGARWGEPLFTSLFLHGDILHLAFNMLFLAVFGAGLEDRLGKTRFLALYFSCGVLATLAHIMTHPLSPSPVIGASGAIAGILGAYFILLPRSWILTYLPPIWVFPVPAPMFLLLWVFAQLSGALSTAMAKVPLLTAPRGEADQIAWIAHVGGFAAGALFGWAIKPWWKKRKGVKS